MEWASVLSRSGLALSLLSASFLVITAIGATAAMVAIWHPDPRRRSSAFKVLELLALTLRPAHRRQPPSSKPGQRPPQ